MDTTHFIVTHVGAAPSKRFLAVTRLGNLWTSMFGSTRFKTLEKAQAVANSCSRSTRIIWVDDSHPAKWGECVGDFQVVR